MRELNVKLRHARQVGVVGAAQFFAVHDAGEVPDGRPGAAERLESLFEGLDDALPCRRGLVRGDLLNGLAGTFKERVQGRSDVFGFQGGPIEELALLNQRIGHLKNKDAIDEKSVL